MTENTTPETEDTAEVSHETVQEYRHALRALLQEAQSKVNLRGDATRDLYKAVNGPLESVIRGRKGVSQEEQVGNLKNFRDLLKQSEADIPALVEAARAEVTAALDAWEESIIAPVREASALARKAANYAEERDFEAHQAKKHSGFPVFADDFSDDDADESDDEV